MNSIELTELQKQISQISRPRQQAVNLLAVSKTRSAADILTLVEQGQHRFGENYLQEALEKIQSLQAYSIEWHYIGKIQSNKTRPIANHFDWVHTVDRLKIAQRLNDQRSTDQPRLNICIQVNSSDEATKGGVAFSELAELADQIAQLPQLRLRGLMALPAPTKDAEQQRLAFRKLHAAQQQLQQQGLELDTLSMGTSTDFESAILEGSTLLRIGTALFGPRH